MQQHSLESDLWESGDLRPISELEIVFQQGLALPEDTDIARLEYRGVPEWDSVGHMGLIAAIEEKFDVMLDTDEVIDMSSFQRARETLARHGVEFSDGD